MNPAPGSSEARSLLLKENGNPYEISVTTQDGRIHCSFLIGKAPLSPLRTTTIPRLELTVATVSVRLGNFYKRELDMELDKIVYHTDSTVVLRYIKSD